MRRRHRLPTSSSPAASALSTASDSTKSERSSSPDSINARPRDRQEAQAPSVVPGKQGAGSLEQVHSRRRVGASVGSPPRRGETLGGLFSEALSPVARPPELDEAAVRLLQVVADDLVEFDQIRAALLQPSREAFVQVGPGCFRQHLVGGVADQQVAEADRPPPRRTRRAGRMSSLRTSATQLAAAAARRRASACTALRWNTWPSTEPHSRRARSAGSSWSRRPRGARGSWGAR